MLDDKMEQMSEAMLGLPDMNPEFAQARSEFDELKNK